MQMSPSFMFRRTDPASRLGGVARLRFCYSKNVATDALPMGNVTQQAVHLYGENWLLEVDSSFSETEGNFIRKLENLGPLNQQGITVTIDEENTDLQAFTEGYKKYLINQLLFVEITLHNEKVIYVDGIQLDYKYLISKRIENSNQYELTLRPAKAAQKIIKLIDTVDTEQKKYPKQDGTLIDVFNVSIKTIGNISNYQLLVGTTEDITQASPRNSFILNFQEEGEYYLFVQIPNTGIYERYYLNLEFIYLDITTV